MQLNIKNKDVVGLAAEVAAMTGETKTEAIRRALLERRSRLRRRDQHARGDTADVLAWLEAEVWSLAPPDRLGRGLSRAEEDELLGFGEAGA